MTVRREHAWCGAAVLLVLTASALGPPTPVGRIFVMMVLVGAAFGLPAAWTLVPGMFALPADIMLIQRSPHSLDLLLWAAYVGGPYLVALRVGSFLGGDDQGSGADPGEDSPLVTGRKRAPEEAGFPGATDSPLNPSGVLESLVSGTFRRAHEGLGVDNLLYFHVRQREATLGYMINDRGNIESRPIRARDVSQGVGWVLRHERELIQRGRQVDPRNLHYHTRSVDLQEVHMYPVRHEEDCLGVLVLEWARQPGDVEERLEAFREDVEQLMRLDYMVRRMERHQKRFRLIEEVNELSALTERRFEGLVHRALELVGEYLPAERIELHRVDRPEERGTVLDQRRLLYRKAAGWIEDRGEILRARNIRNQRLDGRRAGQFAPPDVQSFMAGPLDTSEGRLGIVCLDHPEEGFFSEMDERLLRFFLDHLGTALSAGHRMEALRRERERSEELTSLLRDLGDETEFDAGAEAVVRTLSEHFSVPGVGLYWRGEESFDLVAYAGETRPTETLGFNHALTRAIRDADHRWWVTLPEISRFNDYEPPAGVSGMRVIPVRGGGQKLLGFLCCFQDDSDAVTWEQLERGAPLLARRLRTLHRGRELRDRARRDPLVDCPRFEVWKRTLIQLLEGGSVDGVVLWSLRVPGWGRICEARGRQRAVRWLERIATRITEELDPDRMTRSHGGCFLGFSTASEADVRERLEDAREELLTGSHPMGQWSEEPSYRTRSFGRPFTDPDGMIEAVLRLESATGGPIAEN